jgi:transcription initiation factor IIE alpha subunit
MATAFCPECEEKVTLPNASQAAIVQCPLCDAEFGLAELLESLNALKRLRAMRNPQSQPTLGSR